MADFFQAVNLVLGREGGLSNDPADPGQVTKYGISKRAYPELDIPSLTVDQAKAIYLRDYWHFDKLADQQIANKLLDMSVNLGQVTAIRILQNLCGITPDGVWGPITEAALVNQPDLIGRLRAAHVQHYHLLIEENSQLNKFWNGWLYRAVQ